MNIGISIKTEKQTTDVPMGAAPAGVRVSLADSIGNVALDTSGDIVQPILLRGPAYTGAFENIREDSYIVSAVTVDSTGKELSEVVSQAVSASMVDGVVVISPCEMPPASVATTIDVPTSIGAVVG
ncbi:hypothetical protein [Paraburkholderia sp. J10-1]|uniref:hypothetical protein n=1 Tax=Paraburkholderia sp. J10-1 TaxID=2805430 RepID=UPI002AB711AE|nr:hypothetical protein [Paraburkholderia sp. J10-1]